MRYRPFGGSGVAVSSVSLSLAEDPKHPRDAARWSAVFHKALELGINCFEIAEPSESLLRGLALGLSGLERRLFFVGWASGQALGGQGQAVSLGHELDEAAGLSALGWFDLLTVDEPAGSPTTGDVAASAGPLLTLVERGLTKRLAVRGAGDGVDAAIDTGAFDALATPYSLASEWRDRHRIKEASKRDMAVIGLDPYPVTLAEAAKGAKPKRSSIWRRASDPMSGAGTYQFLSTTPRWTAQEICLSFALSEPALSTVQMTVADIDRLEALAEVPDRDLPAGVSAQIEMARFSRPPPEGERRRRA